MALADFQMSFNGLTIGLGTDIALEVISGLEDFSMGMGDSEIPRSWGDIPGLHTAQSREVTLEISTRTQANLDLVLTAFQPAVDPTPLAIKEPSRTERFVYARTVGRAVPRNPGTKFKKQCAVRLKLADPRTYSDAQYTELLSIYSASGGGFDYGADYGIDFVGGTTGLKVVSNAGTALAYPLLRVYGPASGTLTGVLLTNNTNGDVFDCDTTLLTGQNLDADMRRIVTVDPGDLPFIHIGGTSRYGDWQLPRTPFSLDPGDNELKFETSGTSTDVECAVIHRDTWL